MKQVQRLFMVPAGFVLLVGATAWAAPTPTPRAEASLNTCQDKVRTQGKKFAENTVKAVGMCLKAVANDLIKNNVGISAATSKMCVTQFRKIVDRRMPPADDDLEAKLRAKIDTKCVPMFTAKQTHTFNDIKGMIGGTAEDIQTSNIDTWCKHFGGDGSIDSVTEWEDCIVASHNCEAAAVILAQFPRALEWITRLQMLPNMPAVPSPARDANRTSDALMGASVFQHLLDPDGDGTANPTCGGAAVACTTGCCYIENTPPDSPQTNCVQYTGSDASVALFMGTCDSITSIPGGPGSQSHTSVPGPCGAAPSPINGNPCVIGQNGLLMPTDPSCP